MGFGIFWWYIGGYLGDISGNIRGISWDILGISGGYLEDKLGISGGYIGNILEISWGYLGDILGISGEYIGNILEISRGYLGDILEISGEHIGISWGYIGDIWGLSGGIFQNFWTSGVFVKIGSIFPNLAQKSAGTGFLASCFFSVFYDFARIYKFCKYFVQSFWYCSICWMLVKMLKCSQYF